MINLDQNMSPYSCYRPIHSQAWRFSGSDFRKSKVCAWGLNCGSASENLTTAIQWLLLPLVLTTAHVQRSTIWLSCNVGHYCWRTNIFHELPVIFMTLSFHSQPDTSITPVVNDLTDLLRGLVPCWWKVHLMIVVSVIGGLFADFASILWLCVGGQVLQKQINLHPSKLEYPLFLIQVHQIIWSPILHWVIMVTQPDGAETTFQACLMQCTTQNVHQFV